MATATIEVNGKRRKFPLKDLTVKNIIAVARYSGFDKFKVLCNGVDLEDPSNFKAIEGAVYTIENAE